MKLNGFAMCLLSFALGAGWGAQTVEGQDHTEAQLQKLAQDAHTQAEYAAVADAYGAQQKHYALEAAEEKQEWTRRSANVVLTAAKYPRPVDSAHYLYDYYSYKAVEAGKLAMKYGQMAGPTAAPVQ